MRWLDRRVKLKCRQSTHKEVLMAEATGCARPTGAVLGDKPAPPVEIQEKK